MYPNSSTTELTPAQLDGLELSIGYLFDKPESKEALQEMVVNVKEAFTGQPLDENHDFKFLKTAFDDPQLLRQEQLGDYDANIAGIKQSIVGFVDKKLTEYAQEYNISAETLGWDPEHIASSCITEKDHNTTAVAALEEQQQQERERQFRQQQGQERERQFRQQQGQERERQFPQQQGQERERQFPQQQGQSPLNIDLLSYILLNALLSTREASQPPYRPDRSECSTFYDTPICHAHKQAPRRQEHLLDHMLGAVNQVLSFFLEERHVDTMYNGNDTKVHSASTQSAMQCGVENQTDKFTKQYDKEPAMLGFMTAGSRFSVTFVAVDVPFAHQQQDNLGKPAQDVGRFGSREAGRQHPPSLCVSM